jgi:ATP-binding cassette subfamily B protein
MRWTKHILKLTRIFMDMIGLVWQAQPIIFVCLLVLTALQGAIPLATAWFIKILFDLLAKGLGGVAKLNLAKDILPILIVQAVLLVVSQMTSPASSYLNAELGRKLTIIVQSAVYKKISSFVGIAYFETPEFYDIFRLASQGAQYAPIQSLNVLTTLFQNGITLVGFLGALVFFNPLLAGLVSLAVLPQLYAQLKISHQHFSLASELSPDERRAFYFGHLLSDSRAAKESRLFGLADHFLNSQLNIYRKIHQVKRRQELGELRLELYLQCFSTFVSSVAFVAVVIQALVDRLSLGDVTLYTSAIRSVQGSLNGIVFSLSNMNEQTLFFTYYDRLMSLPQPVRVISPAAPVPIKVPVIELHNVSFRYTERHPWVLRNVTFSIPAGKCLALVGSNGTGKTTLVKLLTRLYDPTGGQILWDGIDIREFDPTDFRRRIGVIFQDFMHYDFTAQENIGLGKVEYIDDVVRVQQAAKKAGIHNVIESLPKGYQTLLSRMFDNNGSGVDLSGGEWQKLSIARMFMREADLLILDEPTAALDAQAEFDIYRRFIELVRGRSSLLISHRFSTVRMADMVAVLDEGHITEYGSHDELLSLGGTYAKLYKMQADRYH